MLTNLKSRPMLEAYDVYFGQFMALMEKSRQDKFNSRIKSRGSKYLSLYQMVKIQLGLRNVFL